MQDGKGGLKRIPDLYSNIVEFTESQNIKYPMFLCHDGRRQHHIKRKSLFLDCQRNIINITKLYYQYSLASSEIEHSFKHINVLLTLFANKGNWTRKINPFSLSSPPPNNIPLPPNEVLNKEFLMLALHNFPLKSFSDFLIALTSILKSQLKILYIQRTEQTGKTVFLSIHHAMIQL